MKKLILFSVFISASALANLHLAPPDFDTNQGHAVFVDFKTAEYDISYNVAWKKTNVKSRITFKQDKAGMPVFDLIPSGKNVTIDGEPIKLLEAQAPDGATLRQIDTVLEAGEHVLELENSFKFLREIIEPRNPLGRTRILEARFAGFVLAS